MDFSKQYLETIPPIYRDVLAAYPRINPSRKKGNGLAVSTIYANLENEQKSYSVGEIREACQNMVASGVVEIQNQIFVHPTDLGEELITSLTGQATPVRSVPQFPAPPFSVLASKPDVSITDLLNASK